MKHKKLKILSLALTLSALLMIFTLLGFNHCENDDSPGQQTDNSVQNITIIIVGSNDQTVLTIASQNYDSNLVLDILIINNDILNIPQSQLDAGFITTIYGITAVWEVYQQWWAFEINGQMAGLGIRQQRVSNNDVISFVLIGG
ncbi:MAG: DUF4430 domain-containing protein [Firmicutes bacterium]|nr:DUF4430 domain-containing protein [Bacillota bacterium]